MSFKVGDYVKYKGHTKADAKRRVVYVHNGTIAYIKEGDDSLHALHEKNFVLDLGPFTVGKLYRQSTGWTYECLFVDNGDALLVAFSELDRSDVPLAFHLVPEGERHLWEEWTGK